jgi:multicomponent Na+:H+ antiporter subunit D
MSAAWPHLPALQVVIPLLGAILAGFLRRERVAFALALAVSWIVPFISGALLWQVLTTGPISYHLGGWEPPFGIEYRVDVLNAFVLMLVSAVGAVTIPFAQRSIALEIDHGRRAWFYCMYLLCLTGLLGIAATGDAFNAFVFLEISSLATYVLIALGSDRRALLAAYQYLIMGTIGATFYVVGVGFLYLITGSLNMMDIAARLGPALGEYSRPAIAGLAFITVGLSLKLALFPLHIWLPNAYAYAPSVATAFLSATATKVAVYLLLRYYFSIFGVAIDFSELPITEMMLALSLAGIFFASLIAIFQTDIKRMFAYSSVAQIGYITLGIAFANQAGLTGTIVHLANHAVMKGAIFLALGSAFLCCRSVTLSDLAGLGRQTPWTMTALAVAGFGIVGTPGTAGFISKWYLVLGALDRGWWSVAFLIVLSSLISLVYVGRVVEVVWFRPVSAAMKDVRDPPLSMLLPTLILAAATVYFGFDTRWTAGIAGEAAALLLGGIK